MSTIEKENLNKQLYSSSTVNFEFNIIGLADLCKINLAWDTPVLKNVFLLYG